ncbi:hypothetical protein H2198_002842 [Neophaeococcomyces mojaviensis]|uniref:Uncharacterized protein n=1 Tax=Neophaeococcomyces mojaviensis TaxID=3383035 RepID=A0ACC3ADX6_9EURO|nr:hypothetical protein H2198_002842 [Knufia sp. JES_112]
MVLQRRLGGTEWMRADNKGGGNGTTLPIAQQPTDQHHHQYGNITVGDNARAHIGDTIVYYPNETQSQDNYETLLKSLTFDRMDARLRNVGTALPMTCEWLVRHKDFIAWANISENHEHPDFLWIKGKPGSGKSTIMKETLAWAKREWPSQTIVSYFFNARSPHTLEKSSLGLYRSLLHQLLCFHPSSRSLFVESFATKVRDGIVEDWTEMEVQNFLIELIVTLQLPSLIIFIDALDEGDDDDVRSMVRFLKRLIYHVNTTTCSLRICLSSRHYPHITVEKSLSLIMEDQIEHSQDIKVYIRSELAGGNSPQMEDIRRQIQDSSAGIFLWVVLVIPILNKVYDKGKSLTAMLRKLKEIPPDLQDLFAQIFSRDSEDLDTCVRLLKWVFFSMRPLSPLELYHAVQQTTDIDQDVAPSQDTVAKYLLDCSHGLVESTKTEPPIVQFIHETVRDYLVGENPLGRRQTDAYATCTLAPDFGSDSCHMEIAEGCLHYLLDLGKKAPLTEELLKLHPLARYAAEYWWRHIHESKSTCTPRVLDLASKMFFNSTNLLIWIQLYDIRNYYSRIELGLISEGLAPPLYYAASIGISEIVSLILARGADVNAYGGLSGTTLNAASYHGHERVVQMLLEHGAHVDAPAGEYVSALQAASRYGYEKIVQMLLDHGADVNAQGGDYSSALKAAIYNGHDQIVQILLNHGADVNAQGGQYGSALQAASVYGSEKAVQMLLDHGADVNAQGGRYGNALQAASRYDYEEIVRMLLDHGADVNSQGGRYGNALQVALYNGHERVVQVLLDHGADVEAQGGDYGSALQAASCYGHERIVQMLLDHGADVNSQGGRYGNALQAASRNGHKDIVQMLLEWGAKEV